MANLNIHFTVICITGSWLNESNVNTYALTVYKHEHVCRKHKARGAVSLFIYMESNFIEIPKRYNSVSNNNIIIGVVYSPPDTDVNMFTVYITQNLSAIKNENKTVYITGDLNINLLNTDKHIPGAEFIETMYSYSFFPLINKPTRVAKHSATLFDNIFCNNISISISILSTEYFTLTSLTIFVYSVST